MDQDRWVRKLRSRLSRRQKEQLEALWSRARKYQEDQAGTTDQGPGHCDRVESNLGRLLDTYDSAKILTGDAVLVLSAAIALHDVGKSELATLTSDSSGDHGFDGDDYVLRNWPTWFDDRNVAVAVGHLIEHHASGITDEVPEVFRLVEPPLPLRSMASLLRLADMLDASSLRAPHIQTLLRHRTGMSADIHAAREATLPWSGEDDEILFDISTDSDDQAARAFRAITMIDDALTETDRDNLARFIVPGIRGKDRRIRFPAYVRVRDASTTLKFVVHRANVEVGPRYATFIDRFTVENTGVWPILRVEHEFNLCLVQRGDHSPSELSCDLLQTTAVEAHSSGALPIFEVSRLRGGVGIKVFFEATAGSRSDEIDSRQQYAYVVSSRLPNNVCKPKLERHITAETDRLVMSARILSGPNPVGSVWKKKSKNGPHHPMGDVSPTMSIGGARYKWTCPDRPEVGATYSLSWRGRTAP